MRTASEKTVAIRNLLAEKKGNISHAQARPMLEKLGFPGVKHPGMKSQQLADLEMKYDIGRRPDVAEVAKYAAEMFEPKVAKKVVAEVEARNAFSEERNQFDVTKFNWLENHKQKSTTTSKRPVSSKNTKAKHAAAAAVPAEAPKRRGRPPMVKPAATAPVVEAPASNPMVAVGVVESLGGLVAAEAKVAEMRAEAARIEAAVAECKAFMSRIAA